VSEGNIALLNILTPLSLEEGIGSLKIIGVEVIL